ncbi:MAG TPA: helix-turn-helix transcriptional regulator [Nocardioides sp.]|nr:helix-turn-helix transcriptional regulator [Nocardioides sp.]
MPKFSEAIDDATPLTGARIDVAARIGWLLRAHRTVAGVSLRQMSAALEEHGVSVSASTLSRMESEGQRSDATFRGYARVLGLPDGILRSGVNSLCRSFPYAPPASPEATPRCLESFSRSYEAIDTSSTPSAGAWLEFARQHAREDGFGLPRSLMEPVVNRLANEVGRGVASARFIRHEALGVLVGSVYGDVVGAVLRAAVEDPDHQNFYDLTSAISDRPSLDLMHWAGDLLRSPSTFQARGASYVLHGMLVGGGLSARDWMELVAHLDRAWEELGGDPTRATMLAEVAGALPPDVQARLRGVEPAPPRPSVTWSLSRHNVHYAFAVSIARAACVRRGHAEEPLLARLLFESFFEPRGVRMAMASLVLAHSPFAGDLTHVILEARDACPDLGTRSAALRVAALCHTGEDVAGVDALLETGDPADFAHATTIIGRSGQSLPPRALERGLAGDETTVRHTLYCLGMAGDARLPGIAADPSRPSSTRRAADWWVAQGSRILA